MAQQSHDRGATPLFKGRNGNNPATSLPVTSADTTADIDLWEALKLTSEQSIASCDVFESLEKLITQLQAIKEELTKQSLQKNINEENDGIEVNDCMDLTGPCLMKEENITNATDEPGSSNSSSNITLPDGDSTTKSQSHVDVADINPNIVQIKASREEIDRRISAFIEKKQREVNQLNNREFCSIITPETDGDFSCARTDAVFVPRAGCKSHIKISHVVNPHGPQTRLNSEGQTPRLDVHEQCRWSESTGLDERLKNIESHLQLQLTGVSKSDLYSRLKTLENRILYLEGLSPEYFQNVPPPKRQKFVEETRKEKDQTKDLSLQEIDERIQLLQASLQMRKPLSSW